MTVRKLNIPAALGRIGEPWSPHVAARLNGQEIRVVKLKGSFDWHRHDGVEEAFFVLRDRFTMRFRDGETAMEEGDLLVVPAGVEHQPHADADCWAMLFEPAGTRNTGDRVTEKTRRSLPEL